MEVINATEKHLPEIYNLICELEDKKLDKDSFTQIFLDNLSNKDIYHFLAHENGDTIGFASLHIQNLLHHCSKVGEIQEIVISKKHQGKGVGSMLFNKILETAKSYECPLLEVCCNRAREKSHGFYINQGMKKSHYKFTLTI